MFLNILVCPFQVYFTLLWRCFLLCVECRKTKDLPLIEIILKIKKMYFIIQLCVMRIYGLYV